MKNSPPLRADLTRFLLKDSSRNGFALIESVIGLGLVSLTLGCLFAANAHLLGLLRQGKENSYATQMIQERVDALRGALWDQLTDPTRLAQAIAPATVTAINLQGVTETVTVESLGSGSTASSQCVRFPSGTVSSSGSALTSSQSVKVTVSMKWNSRHRARVRSATTVFTKGGI